MATKGAHIGAQICDRSAPPAGAMPQCYNCAGSQVESGLEVSPISLDETWACPFQGQLIFERTPATRHNTDTKSCHFARNRCFESFNSNTNNLLLSRPPKMMTIFRPCFQTQNSGECTQNNATAEGGIRSQPTGNSQAIGYRSLAPFRAP